MTQNRCVIEAALYPCLAGLCFWNWLRDKTGKGFLNLVAAILVVKVNRPRLSETQPYIMKTL